MFNFWFFQIYFNSSRRRSFFLLLRALHSGGAFARDRGGIFLVILRVKKNQSFNFDLWSRAEAFWGFGFYIEVYFLKVWVLENMIWIGKVLVPNWVYKVKQMWKNWKFWKKLDFWRFIYYFLWYLVYVNQKNMLNVNKILLKAEIIEKMEILLSKAGLGELLRLELTPGN